jgi:hypothetical protein
MAVGLALSVYVAPAAKPPTMASPAPQLSAAQLAAAFVNAVNAKDADAMRELILPQSLACYNKETEPYLDHWVRKPFRYTIPADYKASFSAYAVIFRPSRSFKLPERPSGIMEIEFGAPGGERIKLPRFVRQERNGYFLVVPCFTREGEEHFKSAQAKRAASMQKAREAYGKLKDPLRSRLVALLKQGQEGEARSLCMHDLNLDRTTAAHVIEFLTGRETS